MKRIAMPSARAPAQCEPQARQRARRALTKFDRFRDDERADQSRGDRGREAVSTSRRSGRIDARGGGIRFAEMAGRQLRGLMPARFVAAARQPRSRDLFDVHGALP